MIRQTRDGDSRCVRSLILPDNRTATFHAYARLMCLIKASNIHVHVLPNLGRLPDQLSTGCSLQTTYCVDTFTFGRHPHHCLQRHPRCRLTSPTDDRQRPITSLRDSAPTWMLSLHRLLGPIHFLWAGNLTLFLTALLVPRRRRNQR